MIKALFYLRKLDLLQRACTWRGVVNSHLKQIPQTRQINMFWHPLLKHSIKPISSVSSASSSFIKNRVAISGIIPMLFVAYVSGPFVTYIHLRIPNFARNSKEMIMRFAKSPPKDTELDFTTMNFFGKPQVVRIKLKHIQAKRSRFGMVNFVRDTTEINKNRAWWKGRAIRQFGVHGKETGGFLKGEVWKLIRINIEKRRN
ncbi:hypothetical protein HI914_01078 [Erysiphe necator]|nr:hypothetical protein HI914_01078 [Erysiphe necator]